MKGPDESRRPAIVRTTIEALYVFTHLLAPVIPLAADLIFQKLDTPPVPLKSLNHDFYNLKPGTQTNIGEILFRKIEIVDEVNNVATDDVINKGKGVVPKPTPSVFVEDSNQVDFTKIDFRVGRISKVWEHETADRLFCEEIDVGEETPRLVASGLRQFYSLSDMEDRLVIVVCNLKETKLQGFMSYGMVLAAKVESSLILLEPPKSSKVGERLFIEGLLPENEGGGEPWPAARIKKLKVGVRVRIVF